MQEFVRFALLGLGVGALYALASQGLIVIYRGSGVLNLALGAIGIAGIYVEYELYDVAGWAFLPAALLGVAASALLGALTHLLLMRPLRRASPLARVIATLGVLITLESIAVLRYGSQPIVIPSTLPTASWHLWGSVSITEDRVALFGIATAMSLALGLLYRRTRFGLGTSATAENQQAAASLGWSPDVIATANWALGSALAGLAAILIAPITTLQPTVMTQLILAATAAALVAGFRSFTVALVAALLIGIAQTEVGVYDSASGVSTAVPFMVIVVWLVARGRALPLRDYLLQRLPAIGDGTVRWAWLAAGLIVSVVLMLVTTPLWIAALTVTVGTALVLLSILVLTGYAGQLSLAQAALAGFGAWVAGRLIAVTGIPFWLALFAGVAATVPLGVLFALPAVRTRGINLAIVTLGLGTTIELVLFDNANYTGGLSGTQIPKESLFGLDITAPSYPSRYGIFAVACLVLASLAVANLRRGRSGRRLIAVRTNERAAAALGINVAGAKLYAFGLSAAIAALGGIVLAFTSTSISYTQFTSFTSIVDVGLAVIGGIGFLAGPLLGATLTTGGVGSQILSEFGSGVDAYINLIGGVVLIIVILTNQDGLAPQYARAVRPLLAKLTRPRKAAGRPAATGDAAPVQVRPRSFKARHITVRYGGTTAIQDISFALQAGCVLGVIGPNGAGKTTLIDAVTGFVKLAEGTMHLDEAELQGWTPRRRARAGIGRSFQSLELFEDATVLENLRAASDPRDVLAYIRDLVLPANPPLSSDVLGAIKEFRLEDKLGLRAQDLPHGVRRELAIARAVAAHPSVLLLDEPTAGLSAIETQAMATLVRRLADEWGMAILVVEHDTSFVRKTCDEVMVIDFGRQIAHGSPSQIAADPAVIAAFLGDDHGLEPEHDAGMSPERRGMDQGSPMAANHQAEAAAATRPGEMT